LCTLCSNPTSNWIENLERTIAAPSSPSSNAPGPDTTTPCPVLTWLVASSTAPPPDVSALPPRQPPTPAGATAWLWSAATRARFRRLLGFPIRLPHGYGCSRRLRSGRGGRAFVPCGWRRARVAAGGWRRVGVAAGSGGQLLGGGSLHCSLNS
jgi:hypothetical protein